MGVNKELQQFEVDSDNDNVSEFTVGTDKEIYINNSQVQAATAAVGNVLTLADAVTGRLEFGSVAGNNIYKQPTAPVSPLTNDVWSDTTTGIVKYYDGVSWVNLSNDKAFFHATINPMGQSIPAQATNATSVKVAWNSVIADNESKWSAINNQYEVPRDGKYLVTAMARVQGQVNNYTGGAFMSIFIDNVIHKEFINDFIGTGVTPPPISPIGSRLNGSIVLDLSAGNLVDTRIFLSNTFWSGATLTSSLGVIHFDLKIIEL